MVTDLCAIQLSTDVGRDRSATGALTPRLTPQAEVPPASCLMDWRGFHTELQRAAIRATQTGAPLSLLMLERQGADRVAEPRGAEGAEAPMSTLAGVVRAAVGERGLLARYSEGRLAVILIDADLGNAERIAHQVSSPRCGAPGGVGLERRAAIGIAQFHDDESLGHLIQRTAEALDRAKTRRGVAVIAAHAARTRPGRPLGHARLA
jgi:GGDEF domain-containing protein